MELQEQLIKDGFITNPFPGRAIVRWSPFGSALYSHMLRVELESVVWQGIHSVLCRSLLAMGFLMLR